MKIIVQNAVLSLPGPDHVIRVGGDEVIIDEEKKIKVSMFYGYILEIRTRAAHMDIVVDAGRDAPIISLYEGDDGYLLIVETRHGFHRAVYIGAEEVRMI